MQSKKKPNVSKDKKIQPDFKPTTKTLVRILKTIEESGEEAKTALSINTHLNYSRLARHILWLEEKGLVESKIDKSKIKVALTKKGKAFISTFSDA